MIGRSRGKGIGLGLGVALCLGGAAQAAPQAAGVVEGKVWIAESGGGPAREVPLALRAERVFAAGQDGVLFTANRAVAAGAGDTAKGADLWRAGLDGVGPERLVEGGVLRAAWSEAARLLAVVTTDLQIRLHHEDGTLWKTLPRRGQSPAFSPDGTRLAYAATPEGWRPGSQPGGFDLRVLDLRTGRDRRLTSGYDDAEPVWTPKGRSLLFLSGGRTGVTSLWSVGLDGTGLRQLTHAGERTLDEATFVPSFSLNTDVAWSADGRQLLYSAAYDEGGEIVALAFGRDGSVREVKSFGPGLAPAWKEGDVLALRTAKAGAEAIDLAPESARTRKVLPAAGVEKSLPYLPPFGERVARGEDALKPATPDKLLATLFRWPATFYPAPTPTAFFVDQDARAGFILSNWCNNQTYDGHLGSDIQLACNNIVLGARGGVINWRNDGCPNVGFAGSTCGGGFGNFAQINHNNGWYSIYAHLKNGTVAPLGATGNCGDPVGTSQTSGNSSGCHLHFEVRTYSGATYWVWDPYNGPCTNAGLWCTNAATQFPGMGCC